MNKELKHLEGDQCKLFKTSISYIPLSSSPTPGDSEDDPWADKTAEISFGGPAAGTGGEGAVRGEGDGEAVDSSDEECEAAPDKMEVDNDQDRKYQSPQVALY